MKEKIILGMIALLLLFFHGVDNIKKLMGSEIIIVLNRTFLSYVRSP